MNTGYYLTVAYIIVTLNNILCIKLLSLIAITRERLAHFAEWKTGGCGHARAGKRSDTGYGIFIENMLEH